ncbi:MAG TPA: SRPBCC family protein [Candidatus Limnocylindrales bacterium]|nr:SRPBCC family protein [Candidatus Limnocylindrales bacterium]
MNYDAEVTIERPIEEVFAFFLDLSNLPSWSKIVEARLLTPGPMHIGSRFLEVFPIGPWRYEVVSEVIGFEEPTRLVFRSVSDGRVRWIGTAELAEVGPGSTRLRAHGEVRLRGLGLLEPLMAGELQRNEANELAQLKQVMENRGAVPAAVTPSG